MSIDWNPIRRVAARAAAWLAAGFAWAWAWAGGPAPGQDSPVGDPFPTLPAGHVHARGLLGGVAPLRRPGQQAG